MKKRQHIPVVRGPQLPMPLPSGRGAMPLPTGLDRRVASITRAKTGIEWRIALTCGHVRYITRTSPTKPALATYPCSHCAARVERATNARVRRDSPFYFDQRPDELRTAPPPRSANEDDLQSGKRPVASFRLRASTLAKLDAYYRTLVQKDPKVTKTFIVEQILRDALDKKAT
jgi:hypothetical protein